MKYALANSLSTAVSGLDPDAKAYISASGATDKSSINEFVKGIKELGLWSNIVCWPLISTQNAGTGTTAYSLGGLGTFNGTLTNGPTWGAAGISFDGVNDFVSIPNPQQSSAISAYSIWSVFDSDQTVSKAVFGSWNLSSTGGPQLLAGGSPLQGATATSLFQDVTSDGTSQIGSSGGSGRKLNNANTGSVQTAFAGFSGTELGMSFNTASRETQSVASTTAWNNNSTWRMGARINGSYYFVQTQAMNLYANVYFTASQQTAIRNLYKSTLGAGLGLP